MPQTSAGSGPGCGHSTAAPPGGTSGQTSCFTIRFPDIHPSPPDIHNSSKVPVGPPSSDSSRSHRDEVHPHRTAIDARQAEPSPQMATSRSRWAARDWQRATEILRTRVIPFVRQPKFWLACITAVAVQVVLALVMPAAEEQPSEQIRTAANAGAKPAPVPSERIVVPAAQGSHETIDPVDDGGHGTTTPLGVAAPFDAIETNGIDEPSQSPRMADNRRLPEGRQFDGVPAGETDGATLRGIAPLEPMSDPNPHESHR